MGESLRRAPSNELSLVAGRVRTSKSLHIRRPDGITETSSAPGGETMPDVTKPAHDYHHLSINLKGEDFNDWLNRMSRATSRIPGF